MSEADDADFDRRRTRWIAETRRQLDALAEKWGIAVEPDEPTADPQPRRDRPIVLVIDAGGPYGALAMAAIRAAGLRGAVVTADRIAVADDLMRPADLAARMLERIDVRPERIKAPERRQTRAEWRRQMKGKRGV